MIATIISVRTTVLAAASVVAVSARRAFAKTAAIATQAFGLANAKRVAPTSEGATEASRCSERAGAVAIRYASQRERRTP
jgi:hypothetical protein